MPYLTTIAKGIIFTTADTMENRKSDTMLDGILGIIAFYKLKGFDVKHIFSDNEFKPMKEDIQKEGKADLNPAATIEHVSHVERNINTIKGRVRSSIQDIPYVYEALPNNFKKELVLTSASMLHAIPRRAGISQGYSPRQLVTVKSLKFNKHCALAPGNSCLVHEERM
jgi:hypothetical protein